MIIELFHSRVKIEGIGALSDLLASSQVRIEDDISRQYKHLGFRVVRKSPINLATKAAPESFAERAVTELETSVNAT